MKSDSTAFRPMHANSTNSPSLIWGICNALFKQGCQIFLGPTYQNRKLYQNDQRYTQCPQNIPFFHKIDQLAIKYPNIFHWKTLQKCPKWGFFVWNVLSGNPVFRHN
jgi:hypothetical protein